MNAYPRNPIGIVEDEYGCPWYLRLGVGWDARTATTFAGILAAVPHPLIVFEYVPSEIALERWVESN